MNIQKSDNRFEMKVPVIPGDIDENGQVNNTVYLKWVQEVAQAHWKAIVIPEPFKDVAWFVSRHEIDYRHPAHPGDLITLQTWCRDTVGVTYERPTEIFRAKEMRSLARVRTLWCPLDARSGKPMKIGSDNREKFLRELDAACTHPKI